MSYGTARYALPGRRPFGACMPSTAMFHLLASEVQQLEPRERVRERRHQFVIDDDRVPSAVLGDALRDTVVRDVVRIPHEHAPHRIQHGDDDILIRRLRVQERHVAESHPPRSRLTRDCTEVLGPWSLDIRTPRVQTDLHELVLVREPHDSKEGTTGQGGSKARDGCAGSASHPTRSSHSFGSANGRVSCVAYSSCHSDGRYSRAWWR